MTWNPKKFFSRLEFREHVQNYASMTMKGHLTPKIGGEIFLPYWWLRGEIRVFWEAGISSKTVDTIKNAVQQRILETIGLPFDFNEFGSHQSALKQVALATLKGEIDPDRLFSLALSESWRDSEFGGQQHADIYITKKPFMNDYVSWGAADFKFGTMVFCLHGNRQQNQTFLRNVALHEANHLLGIYAHCDAYQNVQGYRYSTNCNMHYNCPSEELCPKCYDFIRDWWARVADEYKKLYIR